jgi:ribonuclease T1
MGRIMNTARFSWDILSSSRMAISKRKKQDNPRSSQWSPYLRVWRMVALLVVIGIVIYQRYQTNQGRNDAGKHRDLNANGVEIVPGEHQVDIQVIEEEPDSQEKADGETAPDTAQEEPSSEAPAEEAPLPKKPASKSPALKPAPPKTTAPKTTPPKAEAETSQDGPITVIKNIQVRNTDGKVVYQGNVDVSQTLERIEAKEHLRFPNDGVVFENRERRLPIKAAGYYREWVHPTPKIDGPGPQRIVTGKEGEIFYTHDHYRTFKPLHRH